MPLAVSNSLGCNCCGGTTPPGDTVSPANCACGAIPRSLTLTASNIPSGPNRSDTDFYTRFQSTTLTYAATAADMPAGKSAAGRYPVWYSPTMQTTTNGPLAPPADHYYVFRCINNTYSLEDWYFDFSNQPAPDRFIGQWLNVNVSGSGNTCSPFALCTNAATTGDNGFAARGGKLRVNCAGNVPGATTAVAMNAPAPAFEAAPALVPPAENIRLTRAAKSCPHRTEPDCGCPGVAGTCAIGKFGGAVTLADCIACQSDGGPGAA